MSGKEKLNFRLALTALLDEKFGGIENMSHDDKQTVLDAVKDIFANSDAKIRYCGTDSVRATGYCDTDSVRVTGKGPSKPTRYCAYDHAKEILEAEDYRRLKCEWNAVYGMMLTRLANEHFD